MIRHFFISFAISALSFQLFFSNSTHAAPIEILRGQIYLLQSAHTLHQLDSVAEQISEIVKIPELARETAQLLCKKYSSAPKVLNEPQTEKRGVLLVDDLKVETTTQSITGFVLNVENGKTRSADFPSFIESNHSSTPSVFQHYFLTAVYCKKQSLQELNLPPESWAKSSSKTLFNAGAEQFCDLYSNCVAGFQSFRNHPVEAFTLLSIGSLALLGGRYPGIGTMLGTIGLGESLSERRLKAWNVVRGAIDPDKREEDPVNKFYVLENNFLRRKQYDDFDTEDLQILEQTIADAQLAIRNRATLNITNHVKTLSAMLSLPTLKTKIDPPHIEPQIDRLLKDYDPKIAEALKETVISSTTRADSENYLTSKFPLLLGPSGTGKSYFAKTLAHILNYDFCEIQLTGESYKLYYDLLGDNFSSQDHSIGKLAECLTQSQTPGRPNQREKLVFFDELDKVINSIGAGSLEQALLKLLYSSEPTFPLLGLNGLKINLTSLFFVVAANNDLPKALMDRAVIININGYDKKAIINIGFNKLVEGLKKYRFMPDVSLSDKDQAEVDQILDNIDILHPDDAIGRVFAKYTIVRKDSVQAQYKELIKHYKSRSVRPLEAVINKIVEIHHAKTRGWKNPTVNVLGILKLEEEAEQLRDELIAKERVKKQIELRKLVDKEEEEANEATKMQKELEEKNKASLEGSSKT